MNEKRSNRAFNLSMNVGPSNLTFTQMFSRKNGTLLVFVCGNPIEKPPLITED